MRLLLKAKYIIFTIFFIVFLLVGTKYGWLVQRYTFSKAMLTLVGASPISTVDLSRCVRTCNLKDRELASKTLAMFSDTKAAGDMKAAELRPVLLQAIRNYSESGDVKSAVEIYKVALILDGREDLKANQDPQFTEEIYKGVEVLAVRFPRSGHVYDILGTARLQKNPRDENALAAFKKCLSILPTERSCQAGYERAVRAFTGPFCSGADLSQDFSLRSKSSSENASDFILRSADFIDVQPLDNSSSGAEDVLLRPRATSLKDIQERFLVGGNKEFHIFLGDEEIAPVEIWQGSTASVGFKAARAGLFAKLCPKPKSNSLPKALRL